MVPDLSGGTPALRDVLVAFEWLRTEWPAMTKEGRGHFLCIDVRKVSRIAWESNVGLALMRGLAVMRTPAPLWFLQDAGQDGDRKAMVDDRVPYGTLLCVSDKPLHGEIKLPCAANAFYETAVAQHLEIGLKAADLLRERQDTLHSRKLRSSDEPPPAICSVR